MRILITGCGGFIGKAMYKKLAEGLQPGDILVGIDRKAEFSYSNHPGQKKIWQEYEYNQAEHIICECHLENEQWVSRLLNEFKPDIIYHFAGCATVSSPARKVWESNVTTTFNLLNNIDNSTKPKFILASSILAESPESVYGASKAAAESLAIAYGNLDLIDPVIFRLVAVAGAYNTHGAVHDIVRKFMKNEIVIVLGKDPGSHKPYTHVDNVIDIIQYVVDNNQQYKTCEASITISPHYNGVNIDKICEITDRLCPVNKPWVFNGETWPGDQERVIIDSWILQRILMKEKPELLPPSSDIAVEKAVKDILRLEYGVVPTWEKNSE